MSEAGGDYRSRAMDVRRAARARLIEIRNERRNRKGKATTAAPKPAASGQVAHAPQDLAFGATLMPSADAIGMTAHPAGTSFAPTDIPEPAEFHPDTQPEPSAEVGAYNGEPFTDPDPTESAPVEIIPDTPSEMSGDPEPADTGLDMEPASDNAEVGFASGEDPDKDSITADDGTEAETTAAPDPASDLFNLPGFGEGLVWALNREGILTLQELSAANADDLTEKLGVVGKLLDVPAVVKMAGEIANR